MPRLKRLLEKFENIETAILFGSIARNKFSIHDVDIALKLKNEDLLELGYIITSFDILEMQIECTKPIEIIFAYSAGVLFGVLAYHYDSLIGPINAH